MNQQATEVGGTAVKSHVGRSAEGSAGRKKAEEASSRVPQWSAGGGRGAKQGSADGTGAGEGGAGLPGGGALCTGRRQGQPVPQSRPPQSGLPGRGPERARERKRELCELSLHNTDSLMKGQKKKKSSELSSVVRRELLNLF